MQHLMINDDLVQILDTKFGKQLTKIGEVGTSENKESEKKGEGETSNNNEETNMGANANAQTTPGAGSQTPK